MPALSDAALLIFIMELYIFYHACSVDVDI